MSIKLVEGEVNSTGVDIEKAEKAYQEYIDEGQEYLFLFSKEDIEDLHIGLGDDLFYEFVENMDIRTDKAGKKYFQKFVRDYQVPVKTKKSEDLFEYNDIVDVIYEELYDYRKNNVGRDPSYLIISEKAWNVMCDMIQEDLISTNPYNNAPEDSTKRGLLHRSFRGIPVALVRVDEMFMEFI